jgi:hypothetical protein
MLKKIRIGIGSYLVIFTLGSAVYNYRNDMTHLNLALISFGVLISLHLFSIFSAKIYPVVGLAVDCLLGVFIQLAAIVTVVLKWGDTGFQQIALSIICLNTGIISLRVTYNKFFGLIWQKTG